jgi:transcriptional regulatory protein RtcR
MSAKPIVVLGILGKILDQPGRRDRWRPSFDLCRQDDLRVRRLDLLVHKGDEGLATALVRDVQAYCGGDTKVCTHPLVVKDAWDFEQVYGALHDFARSYAFDPENEEYLVNITTGTHVEQICLFLLAESRHLPARLLQLSPPRAGAGDPPQGRHAVIDLDLSRYDRLASRFRDERREGTSFLKSGIDTRNEAFNRLIDRIEQVAIASKAPLLLAGATGAGKSRLARRVYELKKARRQVEGSLVEVNCATLRGDGAMSALFGHVKGAFTGALAERGGLLRAADGGVLFLDEIGELGADEQAMLLRAIEEKTFLPVGSDKEAKSDFQLIAGSNRDLAAAVRAGRFREDLLARIDLWTFRLPSLSERPEDVAPNLDYELSEHTRRTGHMIGFNREARDAFLSFATSREARWPGNFRDFNSSITRMATLAPGGRIDAATVREETERLRAMWSGTADGATDDDELLRSRLGPKGLAETDLFDRVQLATVLRVCGRSRSLSEAGRTLFAVSRTRKSSTNDADRLRKYLVRFGLAWNDVSPDASRPATEEVAR